MPGFFLGLHSCSSESFSGCSLKDEFKSVARMWGLKPGRTPSASTIKTTHANLAARVALSQKDTLCHLVCYPPLRASLPPLFPLCADTPTRQAVSRREAAAGGAISSASSNFLLPAPPSSQPQFTPPARLQMRFRVPRSAGPPAENRQQSLSCHFTASVQRCQIQLCIRSALSDALMTSAAVTVHRWNSCCRFTEIHERPRWKKLTLAS